MDRTILTVLNSGQHLPVRQPQSNIPQTRAEREIINNAIPDFVRDHKLVPPLPQDDLRKEAGRLLEELGLGSAFLEFTAILLNNEMLSLIHI